MKIVSIPQITEQVYGGKIFVYNATTNKPVALYEAFTDGGTPMPNPIVIPLLKSEIDLMVMETEYDPRVSARFDFYDVNNKLQYSVNEAPAGTGGGGGGGSSDFEGVVRVQPGNGISVTGTQRYPIVTNTKPHVHSNWRQDDFSDPSYIEGKPDLHEKFVHTIDATQTSDDIVLGIHRLDVALEQIEITTPVSLLPATATLAGLATPGMVQVIEDLQNVQTVHDVDVHLNPGAMSLDVAKGDILGTQPEVITTHNVPLVTNYNVGLATPSILNSLNTLTVSYNWLIDNLGDENHKYSVAQTSPGNSPTYSQLLAIFQTDYPGINPVRGDKVLDPIGNNLFIFTGTGNTFVRTDASQMPPLAQTNHEGIVVSDHSGQGGLINYDGVAGVGQVNGWGILVNQVNANTTNIGAIENRTHLATASNDGLVHSGPAVDGTVRYTGTAGVGVVEGFAALADKVRTLSYTVSDIANEEENIEHKFLNDTSVGQPQNGIRNSSAFLLLGDRNSISGDNESMEFILDNSDYDKGKLSIQKGVRIQKSAMDIWHTRTIPPNNLTLISPEYYVYPMNTSLALSNLNMPDMHEFVIVNVNTTSRIIVSFGSTYHAIEPMASRVFFFYQSALRSFNERSNIRNWGASQYTVAPVWTSNSQWFSYPLQGSIMYVDVRNNNANNVRGVINVEFTDAAPYQGQIVLIKLYANGMTSYSSKIHVKLKIGTSESEEYSVPVSTTVVVPVIIAGSQTVTYQTPYLEQSLSVRQRMTTDGGTGATTAFDCQHILINNETQVYIDEWAFNKLWNGRVHFYTNQSGTRNFTITLASANFYNGTVSSFNARTFPIPAGPCEFVLIAGVNQNMITVNSLAYLNT